jgi:starvation-inducible DNA-binding protein
LPVHEIVFKEALAMAGVAAETGHDGTNDVIVNDVVRWNEWQVCFVAGHLADTPLVSVTRRKSAIEMLFT